VTRKTLAQPVPFVRRVRIRNYRSIADCQVTLGPLTVLPGFNASGKTNFLDTLRFVTDALARSPSQAVADRGGLEALLHRGRSSTADSFGIWLELGLWPPELKDPITARYGFEVGPDPTGEAPLLVLREVAEVDRPESPITLPVAPSPGPRLSLPAAAVESDAPPTVLEQQLTSMRFYDLDTAALAALDEQRRQTYYSLGQAGEHLGHVLADIERDVPLGKERLDAYLSALLPGALGVDERREGRYSTVQARFRAGDDTGRPIGEGEGVEVFLREQMSEGTLRAAGVLAALSQLPVLLGRIALIGIDEPETALHPAGIGALYEALDDASRHTQVIVTSKSSDLLDSEYARPEHVRVVANVDGATRVGEIDASGRAILEKGLMTLAELHRSGQMRPEATAGTKAARAGRHDPGRDQHPDGGAGRCRRRVSAAAQDRGGGDTAPVAGPAPAVPARARYPARARGKAPNGSRSTPGRASHL
jgi:predicted ATPase